MDVHTEHKWASSPSHFSAFLRITNFPPNCLSRSKVALMVNILQKVFHSEDTEGDGETERDAPFLPHPHMQQEKRTSESQRLHLQASK